MRHTLLLAFLLLASPSVHAQGDQRLAVLRPAPALHVYDGTYVAGRDTLRVRSDAGRLGMTVQGTQAVVRLAPLAAREAAVEVHAARVLDGWVAGDIAPTAAVLGPARRAEGTAYVRGFLRVVDARYGAVRAYRLVGTHRRLDGRVETLADLTFADRRTLLVRLVWEDGATPRLLRVARGASPMALHLASAAAPDEFRLATAQVVFRRGADDGITALTLRDASGVLTFRRLAR